MYRLVRIAFIFLLSLGPILLSAQITDTTTVENDTSKIEKVTVDNSNLAEGIKENDEEIRILKGDVRLRQGDVFMSCDTAYLYVSTNNLIAYQDVLIQQGDTLAIYADSLVYQGNEKIADLYGEVVLENKEQRLFTNHLTYDLNTKVATYFSGALLTNDSTQLTSRRGYYYVDLDEAYFKDTVYVVDPEFSLICDTLNYNTKTRIATFLGPTRVDQNEGKIYCERGFFNTKTRDAKLFNNAQYVKEDQQATADTIFYDGALKQVILEGNAQFQDSVKNAQADRIRYDEEAEIIYLEGNASYYSDTQSTESDTIVYDQKQDRFRTTGRATIVEKNQILQADIVDFDDQLGLGHAEGNVVWVDTAEQITIVSEVVDYNKKTDYILAYGGRPMLITEVDADSMWLTSDTLVSFIENPDDSLRTLLAYHDVRVFKSDLQAVCDSMAYSTADSMFRFYQDPIIWSDTSQFSADTVHIQMANQQIDRIFMHNKAFIINSPDEIFFNQIKGREIVAKFIDSDLRRMLVEGNAETIYYMLDEEDAYLGVDKTVCSKMLIFFGDNKLDNIRYYNKPTGNLTPMQKADHNAFRLEGFRWETKRRPRSLADLF